MVGSLSVCLFLTPSLSLSSLLSPFLFELTLSPGLPAKPFIFGQLQALLQHNGMALLLPNLHFLTRIL